VTSNAARHPVGTEIWSCYPNYLVCQNDHLLKYYETGYQADLRRMSGHSFFECRQCQPSTYFFAVFSTSPDPHVTCYALSRESFEHWNKTDEPTPPTPEMLYRIRDPQGRSYNPYWKGPR